MQQQMQQQIFSGMETTNTPVQPQPVRPIPTGPTSLAGPTGPSFRGRAVALGPRGRGGFQQRGGRGGNIPPTHGHHDILPFSTSGANTNTTSVTLTT